LQGVTHSIFCLLVISVPYCARYFSGVVSAISPLHHVSGRGIERTKIFRNRKDREDFFARLAMLCREESIAVSAWSLMSNHYHILVRTDRQPLAAGMRRLLTGYAECKKYK